MKVTSGELLGALKSQGYNMPTAWELAPILRGMLIDNINSSVPYGAVAKVLTSNIAVMASADNARISFTDGTIKPSIFSTVPGGGGGGQADLALMYNYGAEIHKSPVILRIGNRCLRLDLIPGFAKHPAGNFLQKTASEFEAKYPYCTVTVF